MIVTIGVLMEYIFDLQGFVGASALISGGRVELEKTTVLNPTGIVSRQEGEWVTISGGTPSLTTHHVSAEAFVA
jgi:hypothetical protein